MKNTTILILLVVILGCSSNQTKTDKISNDTIAIKSFPPKPLIIDNGEEEGWGADIRLSIISVDSIYGSTIYRTNSSYKGKNIGLEIEFAKNNKNILTFRSSDSLSDNLLVTLSDLYELKRVKGRQFISSFEVKYIDLHAFAKTNLGGEVLGQMAPKEYKLFFTGKNDDEYGEFYLNINDEELWLELREKDPEYRPFIIDLLTQK